MAYSAHPVVATGDLWTASNQNTYVKANFDAGVPGIYTTAGDLAVATGPTAAVRLPIGTNGYVLTVNTGLAHKMSWQNVGVTNGNAHDHSGGDGSQINHTTLSNVGSNTHAQIDTALTNSVNHIAAAAPHSGHMTIPYIARASRATAQAIADASATVINFTTITYDPNTRISTGVNWQFVAQVAGYYRVSAAVMFDQYTWAAGEVAGLDLYKNGVQVSGLDRRDFGVTEVDAVNVFLHGTDTVYLGVGDYVQVKVYQDSSGSKNTLNNGTYNYICIEQVR